MSTFKEEGENITRQVQRQEIKILVWGSGDPGPTASPEKRKAYEKRVQIKKVLESTFPNAEVHFSEDPEMIQLTDHLVGQLRKEAVQARIADLIIMLDISRGADLELDHFVPTYSWLRDKVHAFLPERYVSSQGLVKEVFDHLKPEQVEGFTDQEFEECTVATVKAIRPAESMAYDLMLQGR